ncbi:MAG: hypothetical protein H0V33_10370 [Acidimicrobiia bacterium]|nr:hypothetical protein [Acidimicrobiia bacterium]
MEWFASAWAGAALGIGLAELAAVNDDARVLVGITSVVFSAAAVAAAYAARRGRLRLAGGLLVVSAFAPTYFFWFPNVVAVLVGIALLVSSRSAAVSRPPRAHPERGPSAGGVAA